MVFELDVQMRQHQCVVPLSASVLFDEKCVEMLRPASTWMSAGVTYRLPRIPVTLPQRWGDQQPLAVPSRTVMQPLFEVGIPLLYSVFSVPLSSKETAFSRQRFGHVASNAPSPPRLEVGMPPLPAKDESERTKRFLNEAARWDCKLDTLQALHRAGVNIEATERTLQRTALHLAATVNRLDVVEFLISVGSQVDREDGTLNTPLTTAAISEGEFAESIVRCLHRCGASIHTQNRSGGAPLHSAVYTSNLSLLRFLLSVGANPNVANARGLTPLHVAAWRGVDSVIQLLCDAGGDGNAVTDFGATPGRLAALEGFPACVRAFHASDDDALP